MIRLALALPDDSRTPETVAEDILKRMAFLRRFNRLNSEVRESFGTNAPTSEEEIFEEIS